MTLNELKLDLIDQIIKCNDAEILLKISDLLSNNKYLEFNKNLSLVNEPTLKYDTFTNEKIRVFSDLEQRKINLALKQFEDGECISDEEAQKEIQSWLED